MILLVILRYIRHWRWCVVYILCITPWIIVLRHTATQSKIFDICQGMISTLTKTESNKKPMLSFILHARLVILNNIRRFWSEMSAGQDGPGVLVSCPVRSFRTGRHLNFRPVLPPARTAIGRTAGQDRTEKLVLCSSMFDIKRMTQSISLFFYAYCIKPAPKTISFRQKFWHWSECMGR
jgi:hypothetical protein